MVYKSLLTPPQIKPYILAWETDPNCEEKPKSWSSRLQVSYKGILNVSLIEASLKVLTRWYLVPTHWPECIRQLLKSVIASYKALCFTFGGNARKLGIFGTGCFRCSVS